MRALFLDDEQTLWVGTKGDGILRMLRYAPDTGGKFDVERLHTGNSSLTDNSVYCFAPSCWNRLWIWNGAWDELLFLSGEKSKRVSCYG